MNATDTNAKKKNKPKKPKQNSFQTSLSSDE